jgi:DNA-binding SARP family transcriptional activator
MTHTLVPSGPAPLRVSVLGGFRLVEGHAAMPVPGSAERLVAFLALARGVVKRALVAGTLWPEASERHAFGNLRSALSRLGAAGRRAVRSDPVDLELASDVLVDVRDARGLALRLLAPDAPRPADLSPATVVVLTDELLPGWYDDWVLVEAEEWRQLRLHALEALARHLTKAGRFGEAVAAATASVRAEPLRETAHASLIRVHLAEGNHSEAVRQLETLRALLRAELGLEPSARLDELVRHAR